MMVLVGLLILTVLGCTSEDFPPLVPGHQCCWAEREGPWPQDACLDPDVTIRDVKDGWVRYARGRYALDNRMKLKQFHDLYICKPLGTKEGS